MAISPLSGSISPDEDLEKGGFAGAVGADQAVAVAGGELDVDVLEEDPLAIG